MTQYEQAVSRYLTFLNDPDAPLDPEALEAAQEEIDAATTPVQQLRAHNRMQQLRTTDAAALEAAFVKAAPRFAKREGITPEAFLAVGVPREVLARTGMLDAAPAKMRAGSVSQALVSDWALNQTEPFTIKDAVDGSGASQLTVRRALQALLDEGTLRVVPRPDDSTSRRNAVHFSPVAPADDSYDPAAETVDLEAQTQDDELTVDDSAAPQEEGPEPTKGRSRRTRADENTSEQGEEDTKTRRGTKSTEPTKRRAAAPKATMRRAVRTRRA